MDTALQTIPSTDAVGPTREKFREVTTVRRNRESGMLFSKSGSHVYPSLVALAAATLLPSGCGSSSTSSTNTNSQTVTYIAEVGEDFKTQYDRRDSRLRVIYDNGTESDLLMRSFQRALHRDETARIITNPDAGPLFAQEPAEDDLASGTIYVLRSKSKQPEIAAHRDVLHKIGVTAFVLGIFAWALCCCHISILLWGWNAASRLDGRLARCYNPHQRGTLLYCGAPRTARRKSFIQPNAAKVAIPVN
jgi:hypothetical protein